MTNESNQNDFKSIPLNSIKILKSKLNPINPEERKPKPVDYYINDEESVKLDFDDDISELLSKQPESVREEPRKLKRNKWPNRKRD